MKYLLDSNIIIYYLQGDDKIGSFIRQHKEKSILSIITYYEVLNYDFTQEQENIVKNFLEEFEIIDISKNIINRALENRKIKKIKMADNFILATAQLFDLYIVTRNSKDFEKIYNQLIDPFKL